ncbi:helix-turn-helix domain-containing protein [Ruegeria sp. HKCCE4150]|uniref:helix-turn-helix transcriptional regulator n=1 Tax=Ruegeria sp. HKCCE4150 TaxID=2794828 RepID=UPI00147C4C62
MKSSPILVDTVRACETLSVSRTTLWRWVRDGRLAAPLRIGKMLRWRLDELEAHVEKLSEERI